MTQRVTGLSIVMPNYNGETLLAENLPPLISAMEAWGGEWELIVVDDCSTDSSCRLLSQKFPQVKVIVNVHNMGFSKTCNIGMDAVNHPVALCINNDVTVNIGLVSPLLKHFEDDDVFAVTPAILSEREGQNQGVVIGMYGKGFIKGGFAPIHETHGMRENLYAIGACVAYDMRKFRALGGYAEIYTPYLFEDVDISYRAWKRGWKCLYEPGATVYHYSSATIGKTKKRDKRTIYFRNRFLFHWINLTDPAFVLRNALVTLFRLAVSFLWMNFTYYAAFWGALRRWEDVAALRNSERPYRKLGDAEIIRRTARGATNV